MSAKASILSLRFYKDETDEGDKADEIVQQYGFHPTKYDSGPFGTGDRLQYNYQQYETTDENKSLIDDTVEELNETFQSMDVWSEFKSNRDAGFGASFQTMIYVAPDRDAIEELRKPKN